MHDDIILMMDSPILLTTKLLIPRRKPGTIPRPRLVRWIERHLDKRLILVSAPPGYGKTTLLADFAAATMQPLTWYQLDSADSDPQVFLSYLTECLKQLHVQCSKSKQVPFGVATQALLNSAEVALPLSPERILTVLINELNEVIEGDWLIVLEDYHFITNPVVHHLLDYFIENEPPGLHLLISTRSDPPLALARLRARGMLAELRTTELRFTEEEIHLWLSQTNPHIASEQVRALSEKTEGWAASLQLALYSIADKDADSADRFITNLSGSHYLIFDYLMSEVFNRQPFVIQQFLLYTSVLDQMNASMCNALLGRRDSQEMLAYLVRENLFITCLDESREWHRYHHLFREFLLDKLWREMPEQALELERTAGRNCESQGNLEAALEYYHAANDYQAMARVLTMIAPDLIERGRLMSLQRYFRVLPEALVSERPLLLLYKGDLLRRMGQSGEAITCYESSRLAFEVAQDHAGVSRSLTALGEIARSQGDYLRAQALVSQALEYAAKEDHVGRAYALMALAKCVGFLSDMDQGRLLAEQAVAEVRQAGGKISPLTRADLLRSLGQICWWQGDPQACAHYCREALQTLGDELSMTTARANLTLSIPHLFWGDLGTALKYAERGLEIAQQLGLTELLPGAYSILGDILTRVGETARAENCLRQAMELAQRLGTATYEMVIAAGNLAFNLYRQGRVDEARQLAEGALWAHAGNPNTYEVYVCRSVLADIALEAQQIHQAREIFESLIEIGQRRKFRLPLALVYFGLAYINFIADQSERGMEWAMESLRLIEPSGAWQLYVDQGDRARLVCENLVKAGVRSPFIAQVLDRLRQKGAAPVSARVDESLVVVQCLGAFNVRVGPVEIGQERWVSAKARDLLAFFVTFRGERVPLDRILEALWSDMDSHGKMAFHTALYRLRQALRLSGRSAKFILVEAGEYWLDAAHFQIDVDEFDAALAKARATNGEEAFRWYQHAISLYHGEYLANLYYDWVFPERRRLVEAYLNALRCCAEYHLSSGRYSQALASLQIALEIDPLMEDIHCLAMRCYAALGDRSGLMRQYQQLQQILRDELSVKPMPMTQQLFAMLMDQTGQ